MEYEKHIEWLTQRISNLQDEITLLLAEIRDLKATLDAKDQ